MEESQAFLALTALCPDRTLVGMKLLDRISSVPHGELACSKCLAFSLMCTDAVCCPGGVSGTLWVPVPAQIPTLQCFRFLVGSHVFTEEHLQSV